MASAFARMNSYAHSDCYAHHKQLNFATTAHHSKRVPWIQRTKLFRWQWNKIYWTWLKHNSKVWRCKYHSDPSSHPTQSCHFHHSSSPLHWYITSVFPAVVHFTARTVVQNHWYPSIPEDLNLHHRYCENLNLSQLYDLEKYVLISDIIHIHTKTLINHSQDSIISVLKSRQRIQTVNLEVLTVMSVNVLTWNNK